VWQTGGEREAASMRVSRALFVIALSGFLGAGMLASCERAAPTPAANPIPTITIVDDDSVDNLRSTFQNLHTAQTSGDVERAMIITKRLLPDEERIRKGLAPDILPEAVRRIVQMHKEDYPEDEKLLSVRIAGGWSASGVLISSATTEEIAARQTLDSQDFPLAAQHMAEERLLRPGLRYHLVRLVKPGESLGIPVHLVFFDGTQWTVLGPIWRVLRDPDGLLPASVTGREPGTPPPASAGGNPEQGPGVLGSPR
jgi:hypothetical protein